MNEADIDMNVPVMRARIREIPWLEALLSPSDDDARTLATAWHLGATEWSNPHPLIDLMFGDRWAKVRDAIAGGIGLLHLTDRDRSGFRRRLVTANRASCADAAAAIAELDAACRFAFAQSEATFVATGGERTPDLEVKRGDAELVVEAFSLQLAEPDREHADAQTAAFSRWALGEPRPAALARTAFDLGGGLQMLRRNVRVLGAQRAT